MSRLKRQNIRLPVADEKERTTLRPLCFKWNDFDWEKRDRSAKVEQLPGYIPRLGIRRLENRVEHAFKQVNRPLVVVRRIEMEVTERVRSFQLVSHDVQELVGLPETDVTEEFRQRVHTHNEVHLVTGPV